MESAIACVTKTLRFGFCELLVTSLAVAGIACGFPFIWFSHNEDAGFFFWTLVASAGVTVILGLLVSVALIRYRARGLWPLVGAPFAMLWVLALMGLYWSCGHGDCL